MIYYTLTVYKHDYIWIYNILIRYTFLVLLESNVHDIDKNELCIMNKKMIF